ncbi:MAG: MATE family efflux transporter [Cyclobacteriaceae bacterium]|nr:MATE family efflux transporter [Cyclobacteriaceae bacterium]
MKAAITKTALLFRLFKEAIAGSEQDYTLLSMNRAIFLLAIPMIVEMGMESIFAVVDIYFVSKLNDSDAVAAIGYTESVLSILYSLAMGLGMGATAIVARRVGEHDFKGASNAAMQAIYLALGVAFIISMTGMFYYKDILRLMGASTQVIESSSSYAFWMFTGNYTVTLLFLINAVFRGAGNASIAMKALLIANGLNIILDPILIFGWGPIPAMGVEGAAIATNTGRGIGVLFQLYFLLNGKSIIKVNWDSLVVRAKIITTVIKVSGGSILQFIIGSASWIFLMKVMSTFGDHAVAGYTIAIRVFIFTLLPSWGLANAGATLVGQNLGANQPDRAETSVWRAAYYNAFFMGFVMILFLTISPWIISIFSTQPEVLYYGVQALRYVSLGYIFYGYGMVVVQGLNGAGDTYTPTILNVFGFWVFQIPFAYLVAIELGWGPKGVFIAIALAETLMAIAAIVIFRRGKWKTVKI